METKLRISSAAITDRGLSEKRPQNEDAYLEMDHCGIYAVADGVGGAQAGEVASQMAMEILGEAFNNLAPGADAENVMRAAIERANSAIHQTAEDLPQLSSMATTVVALHLNGNIATIGHVGDSRLYRVDPNGTLHRDTEDHSMVAEEVRAGRMTEEQAENHPSRNVISRALGADKTVSIDLKTIMIEAGTAFLLCSDGITRHVSDQEIKGVLTFGSTPSDVCDYLKNLCHERGAEDNLTAVVVKTASGYYSAGPSQPEAEPIDLLPEAVADEPTIASPRPVAAARAFADEDVLELDTRAHGEYFHEDAMEDIRLSDRDPQDRQISADSNIGDDIVSAETVEERVDSRVTDRGEFSMFGNSGDSEEVQPESNTVAKVLSAAGFLLLGALIGIGAYYFAIAPQPVDTDGPRLSEMRSANIPLSAFEENRRNVDKDPAGFIAKFGTNPQDSEDFYLLGRAQLLTADYSGARVSLMEARNRLQEADPANVAVLASDVSLALAVTNDTTIQSILKKELESTATAAPSGNTVPTR